MRVLVCGGRAYDDAQTIASLLNGFWSDGMDVLIHGGASGADRLAALWAEARKIPTETYLANWKAYGKAAGPMRNQRMLVEGKPDVVVAFPGGRGTADMVNRARRAGVSIISVDENA